jgi:hypothetical protein
MRNDSGKRLTLASALNEAIAFADQLEAQAKQNPDPDLALAYDYALGAMEPAFEIVAMSRNPALLPEPQFVFRQTMMRICLERAERLMDSGLLKRCTKAPGTSLGWISDNSAMEIALRVARLVRDVTGRSAENTVGNLASENATALSIALHAMDRRIIDWRRETIEQLRDISLLPSEYQKICGDSERLASLLRDERDRATAVKATGNQSVEAPADLPAASDAVSSGLSPAVSAPTASGRDTARPPRTGFASPRELADEWHLDRECVRKALFRWRQNHAGGDGYIQNNDRRPAEPEFLYDRTVVAPVLDRLAELATRRNISSGKCPAAQKP